MQQQSTTVEAVLAEMAVSSHGVVTRGPCGAEKLRRILHGDVHVTLSALERAFVKRLREAGLPAPADQPSKRRSGRGTAPLAR